MTVAHTYTHTAQELAEEQLMFGRYREYTVVKDREGNFTHIELTTRGDDSLLIYTYTEGRKEFLAFTAYLRDSSVVHKVGGCRIEEAPTLLASLSRFYST